MSAVDKAKNKSQELSGDAKEQIGKHTGNDELQSEGKKNQAAGTVISVADGAAFGFAWLSILATPHFRPRPPALRDDDLVFSSRGGSRGASSAIGAGAPYRFVVCGCRSRSG